MSISDITYSFSYLELFEVNVCVHLCVCDCMYMNVGLLFVACKSHYEVYFRWIVLKSLTGKDDKYHKVLPIEIEFSVSSIYLSLDIRNSKNFDPCIEKQQSRNKW